MVLMAHSRMGEVTPIGRTLPGRVEFLEFSFGKGGGGLGGIGAGTWRSKEVRVWLVFHNVVIYTLRVLLLGVHTHTRAFITSIGNPLESIGDRR